MSGGSQRFPGFCLFRRNTDHRWQCRHTVSAGFFSSGKMQNGAMIEIAVSILLFLTFTRILLCCTFSFCCYQVSVLSRACTKFLIGSLDLSNCLTLFSIAEAYGSDSLLRSAEDFVIQNFCDLSKMQDFLNMQVLPSLMTSFAH